MVRAPGQESDPSSTSTRRQFIQGLRHAFAMDPDDERLSPEDQDILDKVAQRVVRRGMAVPATMLLESVRPFSFLASQALAFLEPIVSVALDPEKCRRFRELLQRRATVPALIDAIQRRDA